MKCELYRQFCHLITFPDCRVTDLWFGRERKRRAISRMRFGFRPEGDVFKVRVNCQPISRWLSFFFSVFSCPLTSRPSASPAFRPHRTVAQWNPFCFSPGETRRNSILIIHRSPLRPMRFARIDSGTTLNQWEKFDGILIEAVSRSFF